MAHTSKAADHHAPIQIGDLEFDRAQGVVRRFGRERYLGAIENRILDLLMSNPGRVFSRKSIIAAAWDDTMGIEERTVDVRMGRLRKRINRPGSPDPIRSVRALGYKFDEAFAAQCQALPRKIRLRPLPIGSQAAKLGRASSSEPLFVTGLAKVLRRLRRRAD